MSTPTGVRCNAAPACTVNARRYGARVSFSRRYSDEQRAALLAGVVEHQLTGSEVARRAQAGTLRAGLEPFDVPASTVRHLAHRERVRTSRARAVATGAPAIISDVAAHLAGELEAQTTRALRGSRRRAIPDVARDLRELARAGREVLALQRASSTPDVTPPPAPGSDPPAGLLETIAGEHT